MLLHAQQANEAIEELNGLSDDAALAKAHALFSARKHSFEGFELWNRSQSHDSASRAGSPKQRRCVAASQELAASRIVGSRP